MTTDDWSDLADCFEELAEEAVKNTKVEILKEFSHKSVIYVQGGGSAPVDTGNWIANNILTVNNPTDAVNYNTDDDGVSTVLKIIGKAESAPVYSKLILQNNTEYNEEVEYTGWTNKTGRVTTTPPYRPYRTAFEHLRGVLDKL